VPHRRKYRNRRQYRGTQGQDYPGKNHKVARAVYLCRLFKGIGNAFDIGLDQNQIEGVTLPWATTSLALMVVTKM
jgi:hypothetical protein